MADVASGSVKLSTQQKIALSTTLTNGSVSVPVQFRVSDDNGECGIYRVSDGKQLWGGRILADGSSATVTSVLYDPDAEDDSWVAFKQTDDGSEIHIVTPNYSGITPRVDGDEPEPVGVATAMIIRAHPVPRWDAAHSEYYNNIVAQISCSGQLLITAFEQLALSGANGILLNGVTHVTHVAPDSNWAEEHNSHMTPSANGVYNLGDSSTPLRYRRLYCALSPDVSSDARLKEDVEDLSGDLIFKLRPRAFHLISEPGEVHYGLIAQEVKSALDECGVLDAGLYGDENPDSLSLRYEELIAPLIAAVQSQQSRIDELERRLQ
jgi:hypothetical protein